MINCTLHQSFVISLTIKCVKNHAWRQKQTFRCFIRSAGFDAKGWSGCWVFSLLEASCLLPCAEGMRITGGWKTYTLSMYIHCLPSISWPTEMVLIPCACSATRCSIKHAKGGFSDSLLRLLCFDQMSDIDCWSTGFLLYITHYAPMHIVHVQFNLLMGLCGLQPDALMIIFCEVVVMVWPRLQQRLHCLHMPQDQFGSVYFVAMMIIYQELQGGGQSLSGWHINVYLHLG